MILQVALGIVLAVALLAFLPLLVVGTVAAFRWAVPLALTAAALWLLVRYPSQAIGTVGIAATALLCIAGWFVLPEKLNRSSSKVAKLLSVAHGRYFALLDNKPPYQGARWLPLRLLSLCVAIAVTGGVAAIVLVAISALWQSGA